MIPELGHLAMILALCPAVVQATLPLIGARRGDRQWMEPQPAAWGQFAFLGFSFACLTYAFMVDDFSVAYVAHNSNSALPGTTSSVPCGVPTKVRCCCGPSFSPAGPSRWRSSLVSCRKTCWRACSV